MTKTCPKNIEDDEKMGNNKKMGMLLRNDKMAT